MTSNTICFRQHRRQLQNKHCFIWRKSSSSILNIGFVSHIFFLLSFQCMDNVHFNGLFYNTMPNASSSTLPQCVKSDPNLFKDDVDIRFSKTFNTCKVRTDFVKPMCYHRLFQMSVLSDIAMETSYTFQVFCVGEVGTKVTQPNSISC